MMYRITILNDSGWRTLLFVLEVAYLTSQLLSEDQLAFSFRIASGVAHGVHSQSARDAVDAFSQILGIIELPK